MKESVIFQNVTKVYKMYNKSSQKLKDVLFPSGAGEDFYALENISFIAEEGDVIGVIGVNGAGKSTLSNLITGVIPPTSGTMEVKGTASLIAISSGLKNELTGRENIELKCLMLGFSKKEIDQLIPDIIDFAEIGKFIDQPVKSYSSGMKSRLGFAISVHIDPDILVIDEALSVGDQTFADKCYEKMNEFKERGKTIFFISHSIPQVRKFCQKALWLEAGEVKAYGTIKEIIPQYQKFLKEFKALSKEDQRNFKNIVLEKRSRTRQENSQATEEVVNEESPSAPFRKKRKSKRFIKKLMKRTMMVLIAAGVIASGAVFTVKSGIFDKDNAGNSQISEGQEKVVPVTESENERDIRYVTVPYAYIRIEPELNSEQVSMATFGQSFTIEESYRNADQNLDWLRIKFKGDQEGWISSRVMKSLTEEVNNDEMITKIDNLIGFHPVLKDAVPMIGKAEGEETPFRYTEYIYQNNSIAGFTILANDSSYAEVIAELGNPQMEIENHILYHGSNYDFIFTTNSYGMVHNLTVMNNQLP